MNTRDPIPMARDPIPTDAPATLRSAKLLAIIKVDGCGYIIIEVMTWAWLCGRTTTMAATVAVLNGHRESKVICPEMCCYCFDILIGYFKGNGHSSRMNKYFTNDE